MLGAEKDKKKNALLRGFRLKILRVQNKRVYTFFLCLCLLRYPPYSAHALYYIVICVLSACAITFPHYLSKGRICGKDVTGHKMCVLISIQHLYEIFLSLKRIKLNDNTIYSGLRVQWRLFLSHCNEICILFSYFHNIISNFRRSV